MYFLNFDDFGYSKEAGEAFKRWGGRDEVTSRLVYLIRTLKPDVLFTNHDTVTVGPGRQHGQHQAVGVAAYDAFALAADSAYHPEQLEEEGVGLWQPQRLYLRRWRGSEGDYETVVPVGDADPATGQSYAEIAARAIGEHASQGMDQFARYVEGRLATHFTLLRAATDVAPNSTGLASGLPPNRAAAPDLAYLIDAGRVPSLPDGTLSLGDSVAVPGQTVQLSWTSEAVPGTDVPVALGRRRRHHAHTSGGRIGAPDRRRRRRPDRPQGAVPVRAVHERAARHVRPLPRRHGLAAGGGLPPPRDRAAPRRGGRRAGGAPQARRQPHPRRGRGV